MNNGNKKLDELLCQFMDEEHIRDLRSDLDFADHVFAAAPVPDVRQETLDSIQTRIHRKLIQKRFVTAGRWIAAAAAVLIVVVLSRTPIVNTPIRTVSIPASNYSNEDIWNNDFYAMNSQVDSIEEEVTDLATSIRAVRMETFDTTDTFLLDMTELDAIEYLADNISLGKGSIYAQ